MIDIDRNSFSFYLFLTWYRDKLWEDEECEGWTWEQICNRMLDVVQSPHKFEKEIEEYINE